jgi:hypothetical protein
MAKQGADPRRRDRQCILRFLAQELYRFVTSQQETRDRDTAF